MRRNHSNKNGYGSRFQAAIKVNGKTKVLGTYDTPEEAHKVAYTYAKTIHGEFVSGELDDV